MTDLLPCPFCGGTSDEDNAVQQPSVSLHRFTTAVREQAVRVECVCGVSGKGFIVRPNGELRASLWWNKRADTEKSPHTGDTPQDTQQGQED